MNALANAPSLYLRQHAANPVDWQPWGDEALRSAREADRPILLSIGYSACHWCHVMAHECFEDPAIAALMNAGFVNIKVDREERPDLDKAYQLLHQIMSQSGGGWPLTVFLEPENLAPFFTGTYFPPEPRHGLPAFPEVLRQLGEAFVSQREAIREQRAQLDTLLARLAPQSTALPPPGQAARSAAALMAEFDEAHGGWSGAPKFPSALSCELLLAHGGENGRRQATRTLTEMARGGLYDQLGGGFFRYSVDARWEIPHFEKMLYDNAQLLGALGLACARTGDALFRRVAEDTVGWLQREMHDPESGLYHATLDADSEGEEGRFYVWTREQLDSAAGDMAPLLDQAFRLDGPPNFEGRWHLLASADSAAIDEATLAALRDRLSAARAQRIRPGRDDKHLTAWNALLAQGLCRAGVGCAHPEWVENAHALLLALRRGHWRDGALYALSAPPQPAFLDDYAYTLAAIMELLAQRWDGDLLHWATALADAMLSQCGGDAPGALYFSPPDEQLLYRAVPLADEATPAGNGMAARALLALGTLLSEPRYLGAAEAILGDAAQPMQRYPQAHLSLTLALADHQADPAIVILRSDAAAPWRQQAGDARLYCIPPGETALPDALAEKSAPVERAWICHRGRCLAPVDTPQALAAALGGR